MQEKGWLVPGGCGMCHDVHVRYAKRTRGVEVLLHDAILVEDKLRREVPLVRSLERFP